MVAAAPTSLRAILLVSVLGCGNVRFIDAPYAPREIVVAYSEQEDVTVIRWHLGAEKPTSDARFELLEADGDWHPVDFSTSVFTGGMVACGDHRGVCVQLVLAGRYDPPPGPTILRAFHPDYGMNPGNLPATRSDAKTLMLKASFQRGNTMLTTTISDAIGGDPIYHFPRPYERSVWERHALCVPGFHPADAVFAAAGAQAAQLWPGPSPLSTDGHYCAAVRPVTTAGAPGFDESIAVDTLPEVTDGDHIYTAPTEITPFSYKIVLDLSIPVADRCGEAMDLIEQTVAQAVGGVSPLRELPTVDLSTETEPGTDAVPCHQWPLRKIDGVGISQEVKREAAGWPEQHQRFFMLYFNNLRAALPDGLTSSFDDFRTAFSTPPPAVDLQDRIWAFAPDEALFSYGGWTSTTAWLSASDQSFDDGLKQFAKNGLPLISEVHDASKPVPILDAGDAQHLDGGLIRLCEVSVNPGGPGTALQPVQHDANGNLVSIPLGTAQWPVVASDPPAYLLTLPAVETVPKPGFSPHQAEIRYEVCTRYCDHAYVAESGMAVPTGWIGSPLCMGAGSQS